MPYDIYISDTKKYIVTVINTPFNTELARRFSMDANEVSRSTGIKRFLFDVRNASNTSSTIENYEFAYNSADRIQLERSVRSAILASPEDRSHDFVETTMRNAGYDVRLFRNEQDAINWLEE